MRLKIHVGQESAGKPAAGIVAELVRRKQNCVLGLATGISPLLLYMEWIRLHCEASLDFSRVTTFRLDACLMLAFGKSKANAIHAAIKGPITAQVTASALQLPRDVIDLLMSTIRASAVCRELATAKPFYSHSW